MLDNFNEHRFKFKYTGQVGLPEDFPIPKVNDQLFYIQRNLNKNTVIYKLNKNCAGKLNESKPLEVFWYNYENGENRKELNHIQDKLAYGYNFWKINNDTFKFQVVSYPSKDFFLAKSDGSGYKVYTKLNDQMSVVHNIFVYAEEFGVFPQVKFAEFFGSTVDNNFPIYQKIYL